MKTRILTLIMAVALIGAAAVAAPVKKKTAVKKTAKTEKLRVELNLNQGKATNFTKGQEAFNNMWLDQAEKYFKAALEENPEDAYSTAYLGSIKLYNEDAQGAVDDLLAAVIMMDENTDQAFKAWTYSELSSAYLDLKRVDDAYDFINHAVELAPGDPHYAVERAVVKFKKHDYEGAGEDARKAITLGATEDDLERAQELAKTCDKVTDGGNIPAVVNNVTEERDTVQSDMAILPEFPGGRKAMQQFIKDNIKYPKKAYKKGIEGTVVVECNFDTEGHMQASQVIESVDPELDKEALRVCQAMPQFSPATVKGKPIYSKLHIQVKFKINK